MWGRASRECALIISSSLTLLLLLFLHLLVCEDATTPTTTTTTTSLLPLLTGDCTASTTTYAGTANYYPTLATTSSLELGQWDQSIYSTSGTDGTWYTSLTLGCQSASFSCCPSAGLSSTMDTVDGSIIVLVEPVTACPTDYITTIDQMYTTLAGLVQTLSPTTLCCPSSWEIWPTLCPDSFNRDYNGDLHTCYQPLPATTSYTYIGYQEPYYIYEFGPDGTEQTITPDYQVNQTFLDTGVGIFLGVRITRSYQVAKPRSGGKGGLGTGAIIGIAVPIACVFIGAGLLYWLYKSKQRKREERRKKEESEKGLEMPELGEGLRHELERGTKMATPSEIERRAAEVDIPQVREERNVSVLQNATLRSPRSDGPLHGLSGKDIQEMGSNTPARNEELPAKDIKEMESNSPAAHEIVAED